jgi:hypothetical protein
MWRLQIHREQYNRAARSRRFAKRKPHFHGQRGKQVGLHNSLKTAAPTYDHFQQKIKGLALPKH